MRGAEPPTDPPAYKLPLFQHMATERSVRELCPVSGTRLPSVNDRSTIRKSARAREAHCGGLAELEPSMMGKLVPVVYGDQSVAPFDEPFAAQLPYEPVCMDIRAPDHHGNLFLQKWHRNAVAMQIPAASKSCEHVADQICQPF